MAGYPPHTEDMSGMVQEGGHTLLLLPVLTWQAAFSDKGLVWTLVGPHTIFFVIILCRFFVIILCRLLLDIHTMRSMYFEEDPHTFLICDCSFINASTRFCPRIRVWYRWRESPVICLQTEVYSQDLSFTSNVTPPPHTCSSMELSNFYSSAINLFVQQ